MSGPEPWSAAAVLARGEDGPLAAWAAQGLRIGLFGGSFNPAHGGHAHVADTALRALDLDRVVWLVAPQNPLKAVEGMAAYQRRVLQAEHIARHPQMCVSTFEARHRLYFTLATICQLKTRYPLARFVWIMGADSLMSFNRWRGWRSIAANVPFAVIPRPGATLAAVSAPAANMLAAYRVPTAMARDLATMAPPAWVLLPAALDPRSATTIRSRGLWP